MISLLVVAAMFETVLFHAQRMLLPLPCTSQQTGQSGEVTVDTLNAFAPDIRHPYEILLQPNPLDEHAVSLHFFGKLSAIDSRDRFDKP